MRLCSVLGVCVLAVVVSVVAAAIPPLKHVQAVAPSVEEYLRRKAEEQDARNIHVVHAEDPLDPPIDEPTDKPTDPPTDTPTDPPTDTPTDAPTDPPTDTPTDPPTDTPTDPPTDTPTDPPTDTPTDPPTDSPTDTPTDPPTDSPTDPPTDTPTDPPTDTPTDPPTDPPTDTPTDPPTDPPTNPSTDKPTDTPIPIPTATPPRTHNLTVGSLGTAEAVILKSFKNRDFYGFMSLPYAQPPVNKLKFKYPEPWSGSWKDNYYDATYLRRRCAQGSLLFTGVISGSDDCLHLSVYTPLLPGSLEEGQNALPVMVFIHGGAYMSGDAFLYVPTKLMDKDVVVVVVQYRLGLLGFLAGSVADAPGNMGLMDQVEALRWIQKHIHHFAGNPDLVTVFGQSAGGASSSWMYLTPLTQETAPANNGRQLLHRVIPQSGSALEEWTIDQDPKTSFTLAAATLHCNKTGATTQKMVKCMRDKTYEEIILASLQLYLNDRKKGGLGFKGLAPVVQSDLDGSIEKVIPKDPRDILDAGEFLKIPVMTGSVRDEGSLVTGLIYKDFMEPNGHYTNDTEFLRNNAVPMLLNAFGIPDKTGSVSTSMQLGYMPNAEMGDWDSMVGGMVDMSGVMFLKSGLWELTRRSTLADPDSPIFFYSWEFEADDSLFDWMFLSFPGIPVPGGVSHADDLLYLFHLPAVHDDRQQVMINRMTKIWTNFAKYGEPTPDVVRDEWKGEMEKWQPYNLEDKKFMLIQDNLTMEFDFTSRWTYHSNTSAMEPTTTTAMPDMVMQGVYDDMKAAKEDYQIATGVLGVLCGFFILLFIIVYIRKRRKLMDVV